MRTPLVTLVIAAGCAAAPRTSTVDNVEPLAAGAVIAVDDRSWIDCPASAAARYAGEPTEDEWEEVRLVRCLRGRFGDATIAGFVETGPPPDSQAETGTGVELVVLDDSGAQRARGSAGGYDWVVGAPDPRFVVDLDGDGVDEVVQQQDLPEGTAISVLRRRAAAVELLWVVGGYDVDPESSVGPAEACEIALRIGEPDAAGRRPLVVTASENPEMTHPESGESGCWETGDFVYRWDRAGFTLEAQPSPPEEEDAESLSGP